MGGYGCNDPESPFYDAVEQIQKENREPTPEREETPRRSWWEENSRDD
jgi:hypothetical protein